MPRFFPAFYFVMLTLLTACGAQNSREATQPVTVGFGAGTMGLVVEPSIKTGERTAVRIPIGVGRGKTTTTVDGIDYDVSARFGGVGVMADYYPEAGALRVSGGLFKTNLRADGRATGDLEVGANTYVGVDVTTTGKPKNALAPVVSIGFDGHLGSGWGISSDVGIMYVGGFSVSAVDASGSVSQSDLDAEMTSVNDELGDVSILPFVKFGATYRW